MTMSPAIRPLLLFALTVASGCGGAERVSTSPPPVPDTAVVATIARPPASAVRGSTQEPGTTITNPPATELPTTSPSTVPSSTTAPSSTAPVPSAPRPTTTPPPVPPPGPAIGTRIYRGVSITENGRPTTFAAPAGPPSELRVTFAEPDVVSASAECNHYSARYTIDGATMHVRDSTTTVMGCQDGLQERDAFVFGVLDRSPSYSLQGDQLTLRSGATVIVLVEARS